MDELAIGVSALVIEMKQINPERKRSPNPHLQHYAALLAIARRYSRRKQEAQDLLQSAFLVAVQAGRSDVSKAENRRWLVGVIKNIAAFDARSAARRMSRDTAWHRTVEQFTPEPKLADSKVAFANKLPPRLRTAALLIFGGHTRAEVGWLLGVSDMAVRQYVHAIKRRWQQECQTSLGPEPLLSGTLPFGQMRQDMRRHIGLLKHGQVGQVVLASHDPDGHGISFVRRSQSS